jgi:3-isopropylmalate/(R)-2-methylmalate dehydratase small subunit
MESRFTGKAHVYGDDIDTDRIIAGKYTKTLNLQDLADHVLEDLDVDFRSKLAKGDVLVAGTNFGCGSSREQAPLALKVAGVSAVIATYFARIFFRNAINIGLPVMEVPDLSADSGDELEVDLAAGTVTNLTTGTTHHASPMPEVMINILNEGGLVAYLKNHGDYDTSAI